MPDLDLRQLPPELQDALERVWPGCPEAQRRAVLAPWAGMSWRTAWPNGLWPWQPVRRWWRPGQARVWRKSFEHYFGSRRRNLLEATGPRLFDPAEPFFPTPWTNATVLLRSPVPDVFNDGEFWAIVTQLFDGDVEYAAMRTRDWARELATVNATARGARRERWWREQLWSMEMQATGTFS